MRFLHGAHAGGAAEWLVGLMLVAGVISLLFLALTGVGLGSLIAEWIAGLPALIGS